MYPVGQYPDAVELLGVKVVVLIELTEACEIDVASTAGDAVTVVTLNAVAVETEGLIVTVLVGVVFVL